MIAVLRRDILLDIKAWSGPQPLDSPLAETALRSLRAMISSRV